MNQKLLEKWGNQQGMLQGSVEWEGGCVVAGHRVIAHPRWLAQEMLPWLSVHGYVEVLAMVVDPVLPHSVTLLWQGW